MKATLVGLLGFAVVLAGYGWYVFRPGFNKAKGRSVYTGFILDPVFWVLALVAAFGSAALYRHFAH